VFHFGKGNQRITLHAAAVSMESSTAAALIREQRSQDPLALEKAPSRWEYLAQYQEVFSPEEAAGALGSVSAAATGLAVGESRPPGK